MLLFFVSSLAARADLNLSYWIEKQVEESSFTDMNNAIAVFKAEEAIVVDENVEVDLCNGLVCDDNNLCTLDFCSDGNCLHEVVADGTFCGEGLICIQGQCVVAPLETLFYLEDWHFWIEIIIVIIAIIIVLFFLHKKGLLRGRKEKIKGIEKSFKGKGKIFTLKQTKNLTGMLKPKKNPPAEKGERKGRWAGKA